MVKPVLAGGKKEKAAKRKTSPNKAKTKKRTKVDDSSQMETLNDISTDSGHHLTPPVHSSEVPFGASKSYITDL